MDLLSLRAYQREFVSRASASLLAGKAILGVAPTGSGKTVMAAALARKFRNLVVVSHRREIVAQWNKALRPHPGEAWIGTIGTAIDRGPSECDLLIIDEAHRSGAATYMEIIAKYPMANRVGLTATPLRTDGKGLRDAYDEIIEVVSMRELVAAGYLVPFVSYEPPDEAMRDLTIRKLSRVRTVAGDYATNDTARIMSDPRLISDTVKEYLRYGHGRPTVTFAVNVKHSIKIARAMRTKGVKAVHVDGKAPEAVRRNALADLAARRIDMLCNVNLFTEGWDCPAVSCVVMARPTKSTTLYLQSVGRGMRPDNGKRDLIILDHAGNIESLGPPDAERLWSLDGREPRGVQLVGQQSGWLGEPIDKSIDTLEGYDLVMRTKSMAEDHIPRPRPWSHTAPAP